MNGQNRPLPSTILPSGLTGSAISTNSHGPGQVDPALAITTNSWLRDMIADPARAAQVGVLNPFQSTNSPNHLLRAPGFDGNSAVSGMHIRPPRSFNPALMQGLYNGAAAALGPMLPSLPPGMTGQRSQDNLNVSNSSSSSEGRRAAPATVTLANNNTAQHPIFTQPYKRESAATPMSELEIPAKRLKSASVDAAPQSQRVAESSGASDSIPHRPEYFHCGSVVQLTENKLKRIEDLQTHDFESCAQLSPNLSLDCSTLIKIREDITRGTMFLTFSVGDKEQKPVGKAQNEGCKISIIGVAPTGSAFY